MHILLVLISALSSALFFVFSSKIMKEKTKVNFSSNCILASTHLSASLYLSIIWAYQYLHNQVSIPSKEFFFMHA